MSAAEADDSLQALLAFLTRSRGFDFEAYKRPSLERRIGRRMQAVGSAEFGDYLDYLEVHPDEYEELFDSLLINVTEFFRDPPVWEYLQHEALPRLLEGIDDTAAIRVWSAGCATGQEAYTIAMVLAEVLGEESFLRRAKIYATDVDDPALAVARRALYAERDVASIPEALRERYFLRGDQGYEFRHDMRRTIIFGRNNLLEDAPISRLDLAVCRNTVMYFTAETQARVLRNLAFALRSSGLLVLGRSEMLTSRREQFAALDLKRRVFRRADGRPSDREPARGDEREATGAQPPDADLTAQASALEASPLAHLVVSRTGLLDFANAAARTRFGLQPEHVGQPLTDLSPATAWPALGTAVQDVLRDRRTVALGELTLERTEEEARRFDVTVAALAPEAGAALGAMVVLDDVTRIAAIRADLEGHRRDLRAAYQELESTVDELETTNEELQSANEELQTTNEELQSTNEELETMNEELQSTNEELETINDELRDRTNELHQVNGFLDSILTSLGFAVVVLDRSQRVLVWNQGAEELWGVRAEEADRQSFVALDIGLRPARIATELRTVTAGGPQQRVMLDAVTRRGRGITCETTILPLSSADGDGEVNGVVVLMEEVAPDGSPTDGRG